METSSADRAEPVASTREGEQGAYARAMALKLAEKQKAQRAMSPRKIGQRLLREFCGGQGFGAVMPPDVAADLVRRVAEIVEAERSTT